MSRIRFIYPFSDAYTLDWATPPLWSLVDDKNPHDSEKPAGSNDNALHGDKNVTATFTVNTGATISPGGSRLSDFPKSCGFQNATTWHNSLKPQGNDDTSARLAYFYNGVWRMDSDFGNDSLTTASVWYPNQLPSSHKVGMLALLENGKLKFQKGTNKSVDHDRCRNHAINLGIDICFDTAPPSMPTRIEVNGKLLNFSGPNTMQLTSFPTFTVRYVDNSNATGMELINYDESKYVHWIIGTQVTGGTVEGTIWNSGTLPAVVSIEANASIAYSAATLLELNTTYYLKCRIYDANENISPFSSVASFSFIEPNPPDATWWDNNWTRRTRIHLGNDHGTLCKGYTVSVPFETSVFKTVATGEEVEINESVVHPAEDSLVRIGNKTFMCWRSHGEAHVSCKHYNHTTGTFGALVTLGGPYTSNTDIHFYPVMGKDSNNFIYIVIGQHTTSEQPIYRSTSPAVLDFPSSPSTFFGNGTYPRLRNIASGSLVLFSRAETERYWYFYRQIDGTLWSGPRYFINYDDAHPSVGDPVAYCGGVQIDQNDGFHFIITYRDGYLDENYTRGVGYIRSVDGTTWTTIKGTIVGTTTNTPGQASNINWASGSNSVVFQPVAFPAGPFFMTNGIGFRRFPSGTLLFTCAKQPATIPYQWFEHHPAEIMVAVSNTSSGWGTTNLSNVINKKIWTHRQGMAIEIVDDPEQTNLTTHMLCYVAPTIDEQFACEVGWFYSFDYGNIWHYKELSRTSAHGHGMICALGSTYDKPEFLLGRLQTVQYWNNPTPTTSFIQTGDDLRIVWGTRQLDRAPEDYINYDNTKLNYALQATILPGFGYDENRHYYIYYGNYFALSTPPRDPNKIFRFYEGWELYDNYRVNPTNSGWTHASGIDENTVVYLFGTLYNSQAPRIIYAGRAALRNSNNTGDGGVVKRAFPTFCTYVELDIAHYSAAVGYGSGNFQIRSFDPIVNLATFENHNIEQGVTDTVPDHWTQVSGTIVKSDDYAHEGTYSLRLLAHSNEAVAKSTLIITDGKFGFQVNWASYSNLAIGPRVAGTLPKLTLTNGNGVVLASKVHGGDQGVWGTLSFTVSTTATHFYIECSIPQIFSGTPGTVYFDNIYLSKIRGHEHRIGFFTNDYLEEYTHIKNWESEQPFNAAATWITKQYHLFNAVYGTQVKSYLDGVQVGLVTKWNIDGNTVFPSFQILTKNTEVFIDYIRFKDWVANPPEAVTTLASIKDLVGFQRISNTLDLAYIRAQRFANVFETDKEVIERIANYTTLEFVAVQRIANIMLGSKTDIKYIANMMVGDRVLLERIANIIQTDKALAQRVSNITTLEQEVTLKIANMIVYDKEIHHRMANVLQLDKDTVVRFSNLMQGDKVLRERIANTLLGNKELINRISSALTLDEEVGSEISNIIQGDKVLRERIANIFSGNKELVSRISNILQGDKELRDRIANVLQGDKVQIQRIANVIEDLELSALKRFSNILQGNKELIKHLSNILQTDKETVTRIVNTIENFDKSISERISNIFDVDKEKVSRIVNMIQGDRELFDRISNILQGNKETISRIAGIIETFDKTFVEKISNIIQGDKEALTEVSNILQLDDSDTFRIANTIEELEISSFERVANILQGNKELTDHISNILQTDKITSVRIANTIEDFQKSDFERIANTFNVEKEVFIHISNMIQGDRELFDRISNILQGDKETISRIAGIIETFDKTFIEKISNIVQGDKETLTEVSNILQLDDSEVLKIANTIEDLEISSFERVANILQGNKELIERISNILEVDKEIATRITNTIEDLELSDFGRIANTFNVDKESIIRVSNVLQGSKQLIERMSNILQGDKELIYRVANIIESFDKTDVKRIANILQGDSKSLTEIASILQLNDSEAFRIANTIEDFQKSDFKRFSNIFQGNKELVYEISNILQGNKELTYRITSILQGDKEVIQRIANIISTFDKESTKKIASIILFDKEVLQKISNLTILEFSDTQQIANIIEQFDKTDTKKIANILQGNKEAIYEISNILQGNKELVYRLSNIVGELEQSDLDIISNILQTDKENIERISSIIQGDKTLISRIANTIEDFQKSDKQRISNIFNADKKTLERISNILQGNKELSQRINNILQGNKELTDRVVNTIESFDKTDILRISNLMQGDKEALIEMANILQLDTTETFRIANTIEDFQKSDFERIASDIQFDKTTTEKIANLIQWDDILKYRLANTIERFDKEKAQRIVNLIQTEKELSYRVANILQGNKNLTQRFVNIIQGEEELSTRVSNTIEGLELSDLARISNIFEMDKEVNYRIANSLLGNKKAFIEIANTIILDIELESKISNILSIDKEVGYRVSNLLEFSGETILTDRYANIMQLDVEISERISSILTVDKILTEEIANDISFDKEVSERLASVLVLDKIATQRISDILVGDRTDIYKLASQITSDKEVIYEIASGITLEMKLDQRVANLLIGQHVFTQRFSNFMQHDKDFYANLANMVSFLTGPDLIFAINIEIV